MDNSSAIGVIAFVLILLLASWRRLRRTIGRQCVQSGRLIIRTGIFAVIGILIIVSEVLHPLALAGALAGLAAGAIVAFFGLRLSVFERTADGFYYTPNLYVGLAVFGVFLIRIVSRVVVMLPELEHASAHSSPSYLVAGSGTGNPYAHFTSNPLTSAAILLLFGYYIFYYSGVLMKSRSL